MYFSFLPSLALTVTVVPTWTTSVVMSLASTTVAERSFSSSAAMRDSSIACSFLASSYSEFSEMSPYSRASLMRSATSRRLTVVSVLELVLELLEALGGEDDVLRHGTFQAFVGRERWRSVAAGTRPVARLWTRQMAARASSTVAVCCSAMCRAFASAGGAARRSTYQG